MTDEYTTSKTPNHAFEEELRALAVKHKCQVFYVILTENIEMYVGTNSCIQCLKPVLEDFLESIPSHSEDELAVTKH